MSCFLEPPRLSRLCLLVSAILTIVLLLILGVASPALTPSGQCADGRRRELDWRGFTALDVETGAERALPKAAGPGGRDGLAPQDLARDSMSTAGSRSPG
jgi:hypothetical protein